jgi:hypothetical protein
MTGWQTKSEIQGIYDTLEVQGGSTSEKPSFDEIKDRIMVSEEGYCTVYAGDLSFNNWFEQGMKGDFVELGPLPDPESLGKVGSVKKKSDFNDSRSFNWRSVINVVPYPGSTHGWMKGDLLDDEGMIGNLIGQRIIKSEEDYNRLVDEAAKEGIQVTRINSGEISFNSKELEAMKKKAEEESVERKFYNDLIQGYMDGISPYGEKTFKHDRQGAEDQATIDMVTLPKEMLPWMQNNAMKKKADLTDTPDQDFEGQKRNDFNNKALNSSPQGPKDQAVLDQWKDVNGQSLEVNDRVKVSGSFSESNIGTIAGQDSNGFPWVKFDDGTGATMIGMNLVKIGAVKEADESFAPGDKVLYDHGYKTIPVVVDQVDGNYVHVKSAEGQFWTNPDKLIRIPEGGFRYNENPDFGFAE